jgi:hypothetical protein
VQFGLSGASALSRHALESGCEKDILSLVQRVTHQQNGNLQFDLEMELQTFSFDWPGCKSEKVVRALTALLKSKDDGIRGGAAGALTNIGPPAKSAVPALKQALKESDAQIADYLSKSEIGFLPTSYSGQTIRQALREITGRKIPEYGDEHP